MMQKVRTVLLFRDVTDWSMMSDTIATFINNFEDADVKQNIVSWTGRVKLFGLLSFSSKIKVFLKT